MPIWPWPSKGATIETSFSSEDSEERSGLDAAGRKKCQGCTSPLNQTSADQNIPSDGLTSMGIGESHFRKGILAVLLEKFRLPYDLQVVVLSEREQIHLAWQCHIQHTYLLLPDGCCTRISQRTSICSCEHRWRSWGIVGNWLRARSSGHWFLALPIHKFSSWPWQQPQGLGCELCQPKLDQSRGVLASLGLICYSCDFGHWRWSWVRPFSFT